MRTTRSENVTKGLSPENWSASAPVMAYRRQTWTHFEDMTYHVSSSPSVAAAQSF